ncbi:MAG: helicase-related protein [Woeseia sp.]
MLATQLAPSDDKAGLGDNKLNFVSFTPSTSFSMGGSAGNANERVVLFRLLEPFVPQRTALMNLLQGNVTRHDYWRRRVNHEDVPLEPLVLAKVGEALGGRPDLQRDMEEMLSEWCMRYRKHWPEEARQKRNAVIGELRKLVARVCIEALEPDLVILDEFQRFKPLMEPDPEQRSPAAELAQSLFDAKTPEGEDVRTLLLSATPYKLYTADAEIDEEDHYKDFLATSSFLLRHESIRVASLKSAISGFGAALKRAVDGDSTDIPAAKANAESSLRAIMARTERVAATEKQDAMVENHKVDLALTPQDIRQYFAADALFRAVGERDPVAYWKSAPYLLHFMRGYKFNERFEEAREISPQKVLGFLRKHGDSVIDESCLLEWDSLDPANAKLREICGDLLDGGLWKLLWMPPTIPYWPLESAFERQERRTKTLLFSAWNVVPDVVSAVLSYEAERRMMGGKLSSYDDPAKQQVPRLRFTHSTTGTRSRHRLLLLLLPCLRLADEAHPLTAPEGMDRRIWVRQRVEALLADPSLPNSEADEVDHRWEWAAPFLLDPSLRGFVEKWRDDPKLPKPNPEILPEYLDDLLHLDPNSLGRRPDDLADILTEVALGSPGVLAARMLASSGITDRARQCDALIVAEAFWRLFNRPAVISLLTQLTEADASLGHEEGFYWRQVLRYCIDGNLQAVLDEALHLAWEQNAWADAESVETIAAKCVADLARIIQPLQSRVHAKFYRGHTNGGVEDSEVRIRTVMALRFGDAHSEEREETQDAVRLAFNSPFRPFVLTSTSVGQEGLDFHPWCHRIVHWDLPGNPVDLEQREGRVHRYKGHAVRRNLAARFGERAMSEWCDRQNLWSILFDMADEAARAYNESDLIPFWIATGDFRVQRHVPLLPYSREVEAFKRLQRQLAAYRVVFGQPRQEELMTLLDQSGVDVSQLGDWAIDLRP